MAEGARLAERSGADQLHVDIMDGHFVPNMTFGPDMVAAVRRAVQCRLDVHLMISEPLRYVDRFAEAGSDAISFHVEADSDVVKTLAAIHAHDIGAGLVLKPATGAEAVEPYLGQFDFVLCMTVEPGYGGQAFMGDMLPKIRDLRRMALEQERPFPIMVDGGIGLETAPLCAAAGANQFVAGNSLYSAVDMRSAIAKMRRAAEDAFDRDFSDE
jgi:ribulose-phosphate 3-epimerase